MAEDTQSPASPLSQAGGGGGTGGGGAASNSPAGGSGRMPTTGSPPPASAAPSAGGAAPGFIPLTDVQKLIKAGVDEAMRGYHTERQSEQQRTDYVGQKMKDLPAAYQRQLGSDPSKWPAEEQAIRQQFQADFKSAGGKVPDVGGPVSGGVVKPIQLTGERKGDPTARLGAAIDRGVK